MKKLLPVFAAFMILCNSCKKDETPTPTTATPFLVVTAGSSWNYDTKNIKTGVTGSYVLKATSKDSMIGTRNYKVYTNSAAGNDYYSQNGSDYYQFGSLPALGTQVDLLYLKDAAKNITWDETKAITFMGTPVTVALTYTIKDKGIPYTIGTKNYTDVTYVQVVIKNIVAFGVPITPTVSSFDYYYARGIGRIYSHTKLILSVPTQPTIDTEDETTLTSYMIL